MPAHHQRKRTDTGRPQDIGIGGRFGAPLQDALVDGAQLVHVVALVGAGTGVHEGEFAGNKQGTLVVGHRERTGKNGAGLTVLSLAIAEEEGIGGAVGMAQGATLPHKTARKGGIVFYLGAAADDKIVRNHAIADGYRRHHIAVDAAVFQAAGTTDPGAVANAYPIDNAGVTHRHMIADGPPLGAVLPGIGLNLLVHPGNQAGTMPVHGQHIGNLRAHAVKDFHLTSARFIEHGHLYPIAKAAIAVHENQVYILDIGIVANVVVGNIVGHIFHQRIIADSDVVQRCIPNTGMLMQAAGKGKLRLEFAKAHRSGKTHVANVLQGFRIRSFNRSPILRAAAKADELIYFCAG